MDKQDITITLRREGTKMDADREQFAVVLKTWRIRTKYTQEQAGKLFGVSRYTIMRLEDAKNVSWQSLYRVFAALSVELQRENQE